MAYILIYYLLPFPVVIANHKNFFSKPSLHWAFRSRVVVKQNDNSKKAESLW